MDAFLDAMYGTRENIGANQDTLALEKNAEAELLAEVLQSEGWSPQQINNLSGEDAMKVAYALFGDNSAFIKSAQEEGASEEEKKEEEEKEEGEESMEQKVAHADQLGRVMAHAFVDEMAQMEKAAQYRQIMEEKAKYAAAALQQINQPSDEEKIAYAMELLKEAGVGDVAKKVLETAKGVGRSAKNKAKEVADTFQGARTGGFSPTRGAPPNKGIAKSLWETAKKHPGVAGGVGLGLGGGTYAALKD